MVITYKLSEIDAVAKIILAHCESDTFLFYGEMGAGKTTLIKALANALGAEDKVSSPTFSLVNQYDSPKGIIFHFDFYRIEDPKEALDMGLEDYLDTEAYKFIEWPEKIAQYLQEEGQKLEISVLNKETRKLKLR